MPDIKRLNLTPFDFTVQDEGTTIVLHPCNDAARSWIDDNICLNNDEVQWWGGGIVIEHRCFNDIAYGIVEDGLTLH